MHKEPGKNHEKMRVGGRKRYCRAGGSKGKTIPCSLVLTKGPAALE